MHFKHDTAKMASAYLEIFLQIKMSKNTLYNRARKLIFGELWEL